MSFLWPRPLRTPVHPVVPACSPQAAPRRANVSPSLLPFFPQPIDTPCSQASEDRAGPGRPAHPTPALEGCFSNRTSGLPCLSTPPPPSPCSLALPQHSARGRVGFGAVHGLVSLSPPACSCFCPHLYPEVALAEVPDACIDATLLAFYAIHHQVYRCLPLSLLAPVTCWFSSLISGSSSSFLRLPDRSSQGSVSGALCSHAHTFWTVSSTPMAASPSVHR